MTDYTIIRSDAAPESRIWQGGHYAVRNDKGTVALFLFEYPETKCKICAHNEAESLAAAKAFMAIDDLVNACKVSLSYVEAVCFNTPNAKKRNNYADAAEIIRSALEKAGVA
jgi:hypothetical protein